MNTLLIDCSSGMNIFIQKGKEVLSVCELTQNKHTENLLSRVDELLGKVNLKIKDIDVFGVYVGPGSFTGIRVAVSIIKGLAITTGAKICEMSNFDAYRFPKNSLMVLDGFSDNVYVKFDGENEQFEDCIKMLDLAEIIQKNKAKNIYAQNEKVQNLLKSNEISSKIAEFDPIFAFNKKIERGEFTPIEKISPVYLRASQAEIERQKRLSGNG